MDRARERLAAWQEDPTAPIDAGEPDRASVMRLLHLALRAGAVMLSSGAGTVEVEYAILVLCRGWGLLDCEVDVTFTSMTASYLLGNDREPVTALHVVRQRSVDYGRLDAVHELQDDLRAGRISPETAARRLERIESTPIRHGPANALGWGGMAASFVVLLGGGPLAAVTGFAAATLVYVANRVLARRGVPDLFLSAAGAAVATGLALVLGAVHAPVTPSIVVAGGIMVLVPGYALVASLQDAITGFPISGAARGLEVGLAAVGIASGVALALYIAGAFGVRADVGSMAVGSLVWLPVQIGAAAIGGVLYAIATSVPRRQVLFAGLAAAVGWAAFLGARHLGISTVAASAAAAVILGAGGRALAVRRRTHPFLFIVPGLMPLVPGLTTYQGVLAVVQRHSGGQGTLLEAAGSALAIAAGVVAGQLLVRPLRRPRHRVTASRANPS
jgi:uncharacterized membrane protein YjjP (DUF1212 family)